MRCMLKRLSQRDSASLWSFITKPEHVSTVHHRVPATERKCIHLYTFKYQRVSKQVGEYFHITCCLRSTFFPVAFFLKDSLLLTLEHTTVFGSKSTARDGNSIEFCIILTQPLRFSNLLFCLFYLIK